jgi:hypothetical protein
VAPQDWKSQYYAAKGQMQDIAKQAEEANPLTYFAGQAAPVAASLGVGLGAKAAGAASEVAPALALDMVKAGAKSGAALGAASGMDTGKAKLLEGDIAGTGAEGLVGGVTGAALGAGLAGAVGYAPEVAKWVGERVSTIPKVQSWIAQPAKYGAMEGSSLTDKALQENNVRPLAEDLYNTIKGKDEGNEGILELQNKIKQGLINDAEEKGIPIDLTEGANKEITKLENMPKVSPEHDKNVQNVISQLQDMIGSEGSDNVSNLMNAANLSPSEAQIAIKYLGTKTKLNQPYISGANPEAVSSFRAVQKDLSDKLEEGIDQAIKAGDIESETTLKAINDKISKAMDTSKLMKINKRSALSPEQDKMNQIRTVENLIDSGTNSESSSSNRILRDVISNISDLEPQKGAEISSKVNDLINYKKAGTEDKEGLFNLGKGAVSYLSNLVGQGGYAAKKIATSIHDNTPLKYASDLMMNHVDPIVQGYGNVLKRAAESTSDQQKTAIMYGLLNDPAFTAAVNKVVGETKNKMEAPSKEQEDKINKVMSDPANVGINREKVIEALKKNNNW